MRYTTIGSDPLSARSVSVLSLGAMRFGTLTDEATSFAILDRYVAAGGNFIDTSNNYLYFVNGTQGGESEALLGRWRASRGIGDEIVVATKVGGRPVAAGAGSDAPREGLSRAVIRAARQAVIVSSCADPLAVGSQQREPLVLVAVAGADQFGVSAHIADRHARRPQPAGFAAGIGEVLWAV